MVVSITPTAVDKSEGVVACGHGIGPSTWPLSVPLKKINLHGLSTWPLGVAPYTFQPAPLYEKINLKGREETHPVASQRGLPTWPLKEAIQYAVRGASSTPSL